MIVNLGESPCKIRWPDRLTFVRRAICLTALRPVVRVQSLLAPSVFLSGFCRLRLAPTLVDINCQVAVDIMHNRAPRPGCGLFRRSLRECRGIRLGLGLAIPHGIYLRQDEAKENQ